MKIKDLKKHSLPDKPGVYFFKKGTDIIYIGKATSLKDRTRSYFAKDLVETRGAHIADMVFKANNIKWEETDSVLEALILEANLIKKHQPYYNTKEKDDKSFNYVCITKENKVKVIRGKDLKQSNEKFQKAFGPFVNGGQLREALKIIRKFFPYIEDRKGTKGKEEFYKQLKLTPKDSKENNRNIRNIILFFEGKKQKILASFEREMKTLAKERRFEEANEIKKKIFALKHINDVSLIKNETTEARPQGFRIEAYDIAHMSGKNMVGVMTVMENNTANKDEYRKFKIKTQNDANDAGALLEVLERRFAHSEWRYPDLIVVDGNKIQMNVANKFLQKNGLNIKVVGVVKDERHKPKGILGDKEIAKKLESQILLVNNEAHRFAITYHKNMRNKNFLK